MTTQAGHRIHWYVWAWNDTGSERMPHQANMRGTWGWDAECSCGWKSRTGGATRSYVRRQVDWHKCESGITSATYGHGLRTADA